MNYLKKKKGENTEEQDEKDQVPLEGTITEDQVMNFNFYLMRKPKLIPIENDKIKSLVREWLTGNFSPEDRDKYGDISEWDTSKITDMSNLFRYDAKEFNADISKWNVSNVENMKGMFAYAEQFNSDISDWDVSKVKNMESMFADTKSFNQPLNKWGTKITKVTNMNKMFRYASAFKFPLNKWNVEEIEHSEMCIGLLGWKNSKFWNDEDNLPTGYVRS